MAASNLTKGMTIRTTRSVTSYRGYGAQIQAYADVEVRLYRVDAVYAARNRVKVSPAGPLAYGCVIDVAGFPGSIEVVS